MKRLLWAAGLSCLIHGSLVYFYRDLPSLSGSSKREPAKHLSLQLATLQSTALPAPAHTPSQHLTSSYLEGVTPEQASSLPAIKKTKIRESLPNSVPIVRPEKHKKLVEAAKTPTISKLTDKPIAHEIHQTSYGKEFEEALADRQIRHHTAAELNDISEEPIVEARPRYLMNPKPHYPPVARKRHQQGTVLLSVVVDAYGLVKDIEIIESSGHAILDRSAVAGVREWRFEAGRRGEKPIETSVLIPIRYELH